MSAIIDSIRIILAKTDVSYLWALVYLLFLLLGLFISRRKKNRAGKDATIDVEQKESAELREEPEELREAPEKQKEVPQPTKVVSTKTPVAPKQAPTADAPTSPYAVDERVEKTEPPRPDISQQAVSLVEKEEAEPPPVEKPAPGKPEPVTEKQPGLFTRLKQGLTKTRRFLSSDIDSIFQGRKKIDDDLLEDLEELLITSDIGVQTTMDLIYQISNHATDVTDAHQLKALLKTEIQSLLKSDSKPEQISPTPNDTPRVIMVIGVNGVGKTTTIGKLAARYTADNKKVLIAAADTFRAAAVEQATIWAERSNADLVRHKDGSDPAAVAFDGVAAGLARGCDIVLIDTAGRLHTKVNLMEELKKIKRSVNKKLPGAPHETLLVLDATTGQNALTQAKVFHEALDITGIALTKLDGTAKGGIVVSICHSLNVPLMYIGVGEQINDLQVFDADKFVDALF